MCRIVELCVAEPLALLRSAAPPGALTPGLAALSDDVGTMLEQVAATAQKEGSMRRDLTPAEVVALLRVVVCRPGARFDDPLTTVGLDGLRRP